MRAFRVAMHCCLPREAVAIHLHCIAACLRLCPWLACMTHQAPFLPPPSTHALMSHSGAEASIAPISAPPLPSRRSRCSLRRPNLPPSPHAPMHSGATASTASSTLSSSGGALTSPPPHTRPCNQVPLPVPCPPLRNRTGLGLPTGPPPNGPPLPHRHAVSRYLPAGLCAAGADYAAYPEVRGGRGALGRPEQCGGKEGDSMLRGVELNYGRG